MARINTQTRPATGHAPPAAGASSSVRPAMVRQTKNTRFVLMQHPERWSVMGGQVIPGLHQFTIGTPGLNGVDKDGNFRQAIAAREALGWILIPENVDGRGTTYLARHEVPGGYFWCTKWTKVWVGSDAIRCNEADYVPWCRSLIERGVIDPPAPYIIAALIERIEGSVSALSDKVALTPSLQPQLKILAANLTALRAELADLGDASDGEAAPALEAAEAEPGPAPKPKKKKAKK